MQTGEVIKILRKKFGMTQGELAEKLRVNKSSIQKYESGAVQNLKMETIRSLCEIFSVAPWIFIFSDRITRKEMLMRTAKFSAEYQSITKLNEKGLEKLIDYFRDIVEVEKYKIK